MFEFNWFTKHICYLNHDKTLLHSVIDWWYRVVLLCPGVRHMRCLLRGWGSGGERDSGQSLLDSGPHTRCDQSTLTPYLFFFRILLSKYCDLLKFCQFSIIDSKFPLSYFDNQKWEAPAGWWDGKKCDLQLRVIISGGERRECHFSSWCSNIDPRAHQVGGGTGWVSIQLAV